MVMVRRNELACRNAWAASLWEPLSGDPGAEHEQPRHHMATGPLPPANADDIRAVVSQDTVVADAGEDVLLSEARIISEPVRPARPSPQPVAPQPVAARPAAGFDARTALFRAREAHREKTRAREAASRQQGSIEPGRLSEDIAQETPVASANDGSVPEERHAPEESRAEVSFTVEHAAVEAQPAPDQTTPMIYSGEQEASALTRWLGESPPEVDIEVGEEEPHHEELRLENVYKFASEPLPAWFRTDLPRTCRTCRDFRPSVEGDTGWCANRWAFNKALGEPQQIVYADEIVPCESTFGNWWAPVDDVWLVAADVAHHSRPTPLMDRYVPAKTVERKRS